MNSHFYDILFCSLFESRETVAALIHGQSWTAARLSNGKVGVAMHTAGNTVPRRYPTLVGKTVQNAAQAVMSWNNEEASEGMAVINAYFNCPERAAALGAGESAAGALAGISLSGKTLGLVGHLLNHSGITQEVLDTAKQYYIIERDPKPGDYPDPACEFLLPQCDVVVITGSAAINKTMPRLLELSRNAQVILTGPSVPLCKGLAHLGIHRLYGLAITDGDGLCQSIPSAPGSINRFGSRFLLDFQPLL